MNQLMIYFICVDFQKNVMEDVGTGLLSRESGGTRCLSKKGATERTLQWRRMMNILEVVRLSGLAVFDIV